MAYDRELSRELAALEDDFVRWRRGELDPHELNERVHRFHQEPSRQLFLVYTGSGIELAVVSAVARGILTKEEAGADIMDLLGPSIELARDCLQTDFSDDHTKGGSEAG
jgi:hypothetical protein